MLAAGVRRHVSIAVVLTGAIAAMLLVSAPAFGAHLFVTSFGSFSNVQGVAIDQSTGDVYVLDTGAGGGSLLKFDASGNPAKFTALPGEPTAITGLGGAGADENQLAVDNSNGPAKGDIYAAVGSSNGDKVDVFASDGEALGTLSEASAPWGETCGVATDPSGAVYVGVFGKVDKFVPSANPVTNADYVATIGGATGACNLAADSLGSVFATQWSFGPIRRYEASQFGSMSATGSIVDTFGTTLAVDPANEHVYVDEYFRVAEFGAHGEPFEAPLGGFGESGEGAISGSYGIAVNEASGDIYVSDGQGHLSVFGPNVILPSATTEAATGISQTEATLHGAVNPEGTATTYQFEYGTTKSYGSLAPAAPASAGSDSTEHALEAASSGLAAGTVYHYRIAATNANGTVHGADMTFRTTGPPAVDSESSGVVGQAEAQIEASIDPGGFDTTYSVEYGPTEAYGSTTTPVDVGSGTSDQNVSAQLTGLQPDSLYHYRVRASNSQGSASGPDQTFTTLPVAVISEESLSNAGSSSVTLTANVNTLGSASSYHYEYGPTTAYGSSTPATSLGAYNGNVTTAAQVQDLSPGSTYHFRIVVSNVLGAVQGQDVTFKTLEQGLPGLPDGRGYEMVTPARNEGVQVYGPNGARIEGESTASPEIVNTGYPVRAAADGGAVAYVAEPNVEGNGNQGHGGGNEYIATRSPSGGWSQRNLQPSGFRSPEFVGFSSDLSTDTLGAFEPLTPEVPDAYEVLYTRDNANGDLHPFFTVTPPNRSPEEFGTGTFEGFVKGNIRQYYAGASSDSRRQFFEANDALTPNAVDGSALENNAYESDEGALRLVNVLPDGSTEPNAFIGAPPAEFAEPENSWHAISEDGSRVFWTDFNTGALYLRENGTSTSLIDEHATFLTAAADGSRVIYVKDGDLYEENVVTGVKTDLEPGAELLGIAGASEDATYVYFVATGALASGATAGEPNLYLRHGTTTTFIATLGPEFEDGLRDYVSGAVNDWRPSPGHRTAEASPDGRGLVFQSTRNLTGYDNSNARGEHAMEVYAYDADGGGLSCVSCNPSGERPNRVSYLPVSGYGTYQPRLISDGGGRVFFQSDDSLVPQDTNHGADVYEWERDGVGSCASSSGCIYLLSGGVGSGGSYLIDASSDGSDVFFITNARLVNEDENELYDVYDARVGAPSPTSPPICTGAGCQGVPATPPVFATPASATYAGVGNFAAPVKAAVPAKKKQTVKHKRKKPKVKKKAKRKAKKAGARRSRSGTRRSGSVKRAAVETIVGVQRNGRSGR